MKPLVNLQTKNGGGKYNDALSTFPNKYSQKNREDEIDKSGEKTRYEYSNNDEKTISPNLPLIAFSLILSLLN